MVVEGVSLLLFNKDGETTFLEEVLPVSNEASQGFLGIPGISYAQDDLPLAHGWHGGELVLAWATPHGLGGRDTSAIKENPTNGGVKGEEPVSLPVIPGIDGEEEETILAARAEFRDMAPIGIYCTHTTESYIPTYGVAKASGERGGIYQVALALKESLAKRGIPAVVSDTIHDYPDWELSYSNSLDTMEAMKKKYPGMEIFIDVHRDAIGSDDPLTTVINGEEVTRLMLVVGSNKRSNHPNWEQNLAFARKIGNALESGAPGILRSVRVQSGRYNQHLSPKAMLVEVGCSNSSLEQAEKGVDYLAGAIETVLLAEKLEEKKQPKQKEAEKPASNENKTDVAPAGKDGLVSGNEAMKMIKIIE
ncbi:MAG: stage II sporulation protein P [Peptococcaceae bacterium]|nr:stage II sporulation protein P [Peptococcaceae bacterium]